MNNETEQDGADNGVGSTGGSAFLANLHHAYAQTDGTYRFPNSREGDMLKTAKREIETLRARALAAVDAVGHWMPAMDSCDKTTAEAIRALRDVCGWKKPSSPNTDSAKSGR
jgi:hypothetical protein